MTYFLKRECSVYVEYNNKGYLLDALSNFDYSLTFSKNTYNRKTLHSKVSSSLNMPKAKNTVNFSLETYLTDTAAEGVFFEMAGFNKVIGMNRYYLPQSLDVEAKQATIYLTSKNLTYKIQNAIVATIDLPLSREESPKMTITLEAGNIEQVDGFNPSVDLVQGNILLAAPLTCNLNGHEVFGMASTGISFQQNGYWREEFGMHSLANGSHFNTKYIIEDMPYTQNLECYKHSEAVWDELPFLSTCKTYTGILTILATNVLTIKRLSSDDVLTESFDISTTEDTDIIVEYGV